MKKIIKNLRLILTFILLIFGILAYLAGTDIYHGAEPDLSVEWNIFSTFFYLAYLYIIINVIDIFIKEKNSNE